MGWMWMIAGDCLMEVGGDDRAGSFSGCGALGVIGGDG